MGQLLQFAPPVILAAIVEARLKFEDLINQLLSTTPSTASGIEALVSEQGREVLRLLMQGALDVKAAQEQPKAVVVGPDQVPRRHVRPRKRSLETSLGRVTVSRLGYSDRHVDSHMPLDAELALPRDLYSYPVRRVVAEAACIVSYTNARAFAEQAGCSVPPRQAEELVSRAAADFDAFYASRPVSPSTPTDLLVLSCDGKGIVMRKEALRASAREPKSRLDKRRSKGERAQRRRMAEVVAVYDLVAEPRAGDDVMAGLNGKPRLVTDRARPTNKRTWASVEREYVEVIEEAFAEALRRDPERKRRWVVLVDGNLGQLKEIQRCAKEHQVELNRALTGRGGEERERGRGDREPGDVVAAAQQREEAVMNWLKANPQGAIPADLLAQFDAAIAAAKRNNAPVAWLERQRVQATVANAFRLDDKAAYVELAKALNGELLAGFNNEKVFSTTFSVKKDHCYLAIMRFASSSGTEQLDNVLVHGPSANTGVQAFSIFPRSDVWQGMRGVCTTEAGTVTIDGDATFAGTKNGIRVAVVGWPRAAVPAYVTQQLNVVAGDLCDAVAWKNLWTNPVPGSLVYVGNEPYLVASAEQGWSTLWTATASQTRVQIRDWRAEAPKTRTFATQFTMPQCPNTPYPISDSVRLTKCHAAINKRYDKPIEAATRARDEARTPGAFNAAVAKLQRLTEQDSRDRGKECDPIAVAITQKWEKAFNDVVDFYTANEVRPTHPRGE